MVISLLHRGKIKHPGLSCLWLMQADKDSQSFSKLNSLSTSCLPSSPKVQLCPYEFEQQSSSPMLRIL
ncbi:unnamed protein product [Urochloa humidicola]